MATTSASTTITFAVVSSDGSTTNDISVELDDTANGSKTTFQSGDTVHFLVHTKPSDLSLTLDSTMGDITANGSKSVSVTETLSFVQATTADLSKIPSGEVTRSWVGRSGGQSSVSNYTVSVPTAINGLLKCTYSTNARAYKLSGVTIPYGETEIQVLVVVSA